MTPPRILHVAPRRRWPAAVRLAGAGVVVALLVGWMLGAPADDAPPQAAPAPAVAILPAVPAADTGARPADLAATLPERGAGPAPPPCAIHGLQLTPPGGGAPATVCFAAAQVQQNGDVRSYRFGAGDAQGWTLRIDTVAQGLHRAELQARDGRRHGCEAPRCDVAGLSIERRGSAAPGRLRLEGLRLAAAAPAAVGEATLDGSLRLPPDDALPGLACIGPALTMRAPDGASGRFCGQGGAGVEIADDGGRHYRFQDYEGRTLLVHVDASQQVVGVAWGGAACRGPGCLGASTTSARPGDDLAERSFFFGRTALLDGGGRPMLILDGSLVLPGQ